MIKQTLMFTSPVTLSLKYGQLVVKSLEDDKTLTRPIEDIGFVIIDNPMISLTIPLLNELAANLFPMPRRCGHRFGQKC